MKKYDSRLRYEPLNIDARWLGYVGEIDVYVNPSGEVVARWGVYWAIEPCVWSVRPPPGMTVYSSHPNLTKEQMAACRRIADLFLGEQPPAPA